MIAFTVVMIPVAKARPRFSRKSGRVYTPNTTTNAESLIRGSAVLAMDGKAPLDEPIEMNITFYMPIPKSWPKYKQEIAKFETIYHDKKPDKDNLEKLVADALNEVAYVDDARIAVGTTRKIYSPNPRIEINIRRINGKD